jgi:hypothetical protein
MAARPARQELPTPNRGHPISAVFLVAEFSLHDIGRGTMIRLDRRQRDALSDTVRELANFVAAALVLGQIVAERPRSWLIVTGIAAWITLVGLGLLLEGERRWKARS